jgi:hypothetical protein
MPKHIPIPITKAEEPWCKVTLANGAILATRTIIKGAFQVMQDDGVTPIIDGNGEKLFGLNTQVVMNLEKEPVDKKEMN